MKRNSSTIIRYQLCLFAVAAVVCGMVGSASCAPNGPALLLQKTPPDGGTITPEAGVHHFARNTAVTLKAVPKPSYQFICWLGDVSDATASTTTVYLDAPKIVIAAFERAEYELLHVGEESRSASVGGMFAGAEYHGGGGFAGGGGATAGKSTSSPAAPVPEPATLCLLSLGAFVLLLRRSTRRH